MSPKSVRVKLTDRFLDNIAHPSKGRDTYSDTVRTGLHLRVGQRNASWVFEKRVKGGPKRKHTLGRWPTMGLGEARALALEIEAESAKGLDRVALAQEEKRAAEEARKTADLETSLAVLVGDVLIRYTDLKLTSLATGQHVERELRRALHPWLSRPMHSLKRPALQAVIDAHAGAGHVTHANRVRAYLRAFTKWAHRREYLPEDIGLTLEGAGPEQPRDRVLSLIELRQIYAATEEMGSFWGPFLRLLMLTGQRRGEVIGLRWSNVNFEKRRFELTGRQTKNRRPHITHLSEPALAELVHLKRARSTDTDLIFTTTGVTPASGISQMKRRLDKVLGPGFEPWVLHDFRRAMATVLAGAGTPEGVVDRIQNHAATGSAPSAVARVYQQADLLPQRAAALDRWAAIVTNREQSVVPIVGVA